MVRCMRGKKTVRKNLLSWYVQQMRPLPWRKNQDPYRIWISEIMLQQTTVTAVIPYYERFLKSFPNVAALAKAPLEEVLKHWSGLGYYSRARNLHKSAAFLHLNGFPNSHIDLIKLPGFGPYTARAVTSLAFEEVVGVLDGNVIRVLSRLEDLDIEWWKSSERAKLQNLVDELIQETRPSFFNQALMELGATLCTPTSPACLLCPIRKNCKSLRNDTVSRRPKTRSKKAKEIWLWQPVIVFKEKSRERKMALIENDYAPFLKGQWLYPGKARKLKCAPKNFAFRHNITHHEIYIQPQKELPLRSYKDNFNNKQVQWSSAERLYRLNPSALLTKVLK